MTPRVGAGTVPSAGFCRSVPTVNLPSVARRVLVPRRRRPHLRSTRSPKTQSSVCVDVFKRYIQDIREDVNSIFVEAEDRVKHRVQHERDFINYAGLTCQSMPRNVLHYRFPKTQRGQMNLLATPRSPDRASCCRTKAL